MAEFKIELMPPKPFPNPQEFYLNEGLYTEVKFSSEEEKNSILTINLLDCYCDKCGKDSIFTPLMWGNSTEFNKDALKRLPHVFVRILDCTRCYSRIFFTLYITENSITKMGQYPSLADLSEHKISNYKSILGKYYNELQKAIGLYSHGVGIGSFVYLRRIIENFIVKPIYENKKTQPGWDDTMYQKGRFKDKITILKNDLPKFLVENPQIYSIVSKGIHELTEEDCKIYFPVILSCLELIFDDLEAERKKKLKQDQVSKSLQSIVGKVNQ